MKGVDQVHPLEGLVGYTVSGCGGLLGGGPPLELLQHYLVELLGADAVGCPVYRPEGDRGPEAIRIGPLHRPGRGGRKLGLQAAKIIGGRNDGGQLLGLRRSVTYL